MGGKTNAQRVRDTHQPYVVLSSFNGGETFSVKGYTFERVDLDGKERKWEEHDLGSDYSLSAAQEVAAEWKAALVGVYPIAN